MTPVSKRYRNFNYSFAISITITKHSVCLDIHAMESINHDLFCIILLSFILWGSLGSQKTYFTSSYKKTLYHEISDGLYLSNASDNPFDITEQAASLSINGETQSFRLSFGCDCNRNPIKDISIEAICIDKFTENELTFDLDWETLYHEISDESLHSNTQFQDEHNLYLSNANDKPLNAIVYELCFKLGDVNIYLQSNNCNYKKQTFLSYDKLYTLHIIICMCNK